MQKHYQQRDLAAREWKEKGGKVVGYFCNNVPEELIIAAGFFPLRLSGDPHSSTEKADEYKFGRYAPPEGFVSSMLNMILTGRYDFLDYLIIPHARDSIHNLYAGLSGIKTSNPALQLPYMYFLDNLHTTFWLSQLYNRDRWLEFKNNLEEWSGKEISSESLSQAISIAKENKELLKQVAILRIAEPPRISGVEALQIIGSSMFMLKEEHNILLRQFLGEADKLPARDGVRLFIEGSPLDNLQLYGIIESCNATVVAEDNCWGNRSFDVPVNVSIAPMEAIIEMYNNKPPCPRIHPLHRRIKYCVDSAIEAKVQGVIFNIMENDSQAWDIPDEIKALEEKGIPSLYLKNQPYLITNPEDLKASITDFIKSI
jgi:benzoyl-CoA reductase/2-hydroxyglutaryl-CoA dehydratase subunit BcrC/BadD/HgdB